MSRRKALWISLGVSLALWAGCGLGSGFVLPALAATFLALPIVSGLYAAELGKAGVQWGLVALVLPMLAPLALALEDAARPLALGAETPLAGRPARSYGLGEPESGHAGRSASLLGLCAAALLIALILAAPIGILLGEAVGSRHGDMVGFGVMALVYVVLVAAIRWHDLRRRSLLVVLFPEGLVSVRRGTGEVIRWDEVVAVYQRFLDQYVNGIRTRHQRDCILHLASGAQRTFGAVLDGIEDLVARVHERTAAHLVPQALGVLDAGGTVPFGKLELSRDGLRHRRDLLPWDRVADVTIDRGYVVVSRLADSSAEAALRQAAAGVAALVTSFVGRAQPVPLGGRAVVWRKLSVADTPNVFALREVVARRLRSGVHDDVARVG